MAAVISGESGFDKARQEILSKLDITAYYSRQIDKFKISGSGDEATGLCPFHEDHNPSFSVGLQNGLYYCHACKAKGSVFDFQMARHQMDFRSALDALANEAGVTIAEARKKAIAFYDYIDESGQVLFQTVRYEPKDFRQRCKDGNGNWVYSLKGVRRILYNLPAVQEAQIVFVVEGEKDVENLKTLGLTGTTCPMGAGKWRPEYNEALRGKKVIILPDNDEPGRKHAEQIAKNLKELAESVRVVQLPDLPSKGDVTDWIAAGGTKETLLGLVDQAPEWSDSDVSTCPPPVTNKTDTLLASLVFLKTGAQLQTLDIKIEWAVVNILPMQSITLLHGRGGIGKTWLCLLLADSVSRGVPFMGLTTLQKPVVYVDFENSLPVLVDRIRKGDIKEVQFWHNSDQDLRPAKLDGDSWWYYKHLPPRSLIIFDTLRASQTSDENDSQQMAFVMARLKELRDEGFTILLLHHTPKSNDRTYKGSTAILDLADHVLSLHKVQKNNTERVVEDDTSDVLYCLGTQDKTRYEPYQIFLTFDPDKGFVAAPDPEEQSLETIKTILQTTGEINQITICHLIQDRLNIHSKGKMVNLLKKGDGKYWTTRKDRKETLYKAIRSVWKSECKGVDTWTDQESATPIREDPAQREFLTRFRSSNEPITVIGEA